MSPRWHETSDLPSLWEVTSRHGLRPHRSGRRLRFLCPWCVDRGRSPRKGRSASGAADIAAGPWRCWSCDRRGTALQIAAYYGEVDLPGHREREPERPRPPPAPKASERVSLGWRAIIESTTEESIDRVRSWARDVRGWPEEIAEAVSQSDEVAAPGRHDVRGGFGARLIEEALRVRRRLLIPIRCHRGVVRSIARRWMEAGPAPEMRSGGTPKSVSLSEEVTGPPDAWGNTWVYGSLPEAAHAAELGEPIYLVEGGPNFLAVEALLQVTGQPGAVLGFYSESTALTLVRALVRELGDRGDRGTIAPRIVLVPDIDQPKRRRDGTMPEHGVGMAAALACAEVLRGRAGVHLAEIPLADGRTKDDVADYLAREGVERTALLLRRAPCLYPAPMTVQTARQEMESRFRQAIADACVVTSHGGRSLVILRIDPGAGKSWQALKSSAQVVRGELPVPVIGRRPKGIPKEAWPPNDRSVLFTTPDHSLATAKVQELEHLAPGTTSRQIHGLLHFCQFARHVEDVFPAVGRPGICGTNDEEQRCHLADTCPGAQEPQAYRGEVTFAAHALLGKIKADLVIVDESPGVVHVMGDGKRRDAPGLPDETIATLYNCTLLPRVRAWRQIRNPQAGEAARLLAEAIAPLALQHAGAVSAGQVDPFPRRVKGDELVELVRRTPGLEDALREGYIERRRAVPPVPLPSEARSGFHAGRHMPSRLAFNGMRALADYFVGLVDPPEAEQLDLLGGATPAGVGAAVEPPKPAAWIRLDLTGRWALEVRQVLPLPAAPVVMLDATGDLTLEEYRAAYPDRRVVMRHLDVQGSAPAVAVHINSGSFTRRRLIGPGGAPTEAAVDHIRHVLRVLADRTRGVYPSLAGRPAPRLALLTYKALADAMNGVGQAAASLTGRELREAVLEYERRGFSFSDPKGESSIGYFGLHDRGQNDWQDVDGFAVVGDPVSNLGDISADAEFLGLDADAIARARTAATCRQAIARARHIQRDADHRVVLLFAGRTPPDIRGVIWTEEPLACGPAPAAATEDLVALLMLVESREMVVGTKPLELFDRSGTPWEALDMGTLPRGRLVRAIKRVVSDRRLRPFEVNIGQRHGSAIIYAPVLDAVSLWADRHGLPLIESA